MLTVSPPAAAHAIVVASAPAAGSTVNGPNLDIRVQFNSRIDHERSKLVVMSDDGRAYSVELQEGEDDDMLVGHAQGVPAGTYRLRWVVLAIDGHITRGDIPFTVASP